ncbi:hypothetical protein MMC26_003665 [Xylographa opegraphella]|nr:hypothetical protein [Xylographa opegraphella]
MSPPRRRSSRLKGSATPTRSFASYAANKLSSLLERAETPSSVKSTKASVFIEESSSDSTTMPGAFVQDDSLYMTPQPEVNTRPSCGEVHPSKIHTKTSKTTTSRPSLHSADTNPIKLNPTKPILEPASVNMPSQPVGTPLKKSALNSPGFDFKWSRPDTILSPEAQKIMESVREEAARIKAKMQAEKDEQERKDSESDQFVTTVGRKIATPKGMAGRYSNVHMQEFQKMDSIANHVSTWKNKFQAGSSPLKRSQSKTNLNKHGRPVPMSSEFISDLSSNSDAKERLENTAPGKRAKQNYRDDTSSGRPVSRDAKQQSGGFVRSKSGLPSVMTTPTKASLARATSIKHSQTTTKIPTLGRSMSLKDISSPAGSKTEGSNKYLSSLSRMGVKSIMHKSQPKYSHDPLKVAEGTHLPLPSKNMALNKDLPSLPGTPLRGIQYSPSLRRVNFTPTTKATHDLAAASPSSSKVSSLRFRSQDAMPSKAPDSVIYPTLVQTEPTNSNLTQAGEFTFRSTKTARFGPTASGISIPTIRPVRPSGIATPLVAFETVPSIPHGISNNKRRRADSSGDEDEENMPPQGEQADEGRKAKKVKIATPSKEFPTAGSSKGERKKVAGKNAKSGNKKPKGVLSLSRLNMLSRPRTRG